MDPCANRFKMRTRCYPNMSHTKPTLLTHALAISLALGGLLDHRIAHSQTTSSPRPFAETGIERLKPDPLPWADAPGFDFRIETPARTPVPRAVDELRFVLGAVVVEGGTALDEAALHAPFQSLVGQRIALEDLRQAADRLESAYRARGFFLVRVLIPPQRVREGRFVIRVIEGYVASAFVEGGSESLRKRVETMLARLVGVRPASLQAIERELLLINDLPGVQARGTLRQGTSEGAVEIVVTTGTAEDTGTVSINNHASRSLGTWGYSAGMQWREALEGRGELAANLLGSGPDVMRAIALRYAFPIGYSGTVAQIGTLAALARPIGSLRDDLGLDIESQSANLAFKLRHPLYRSRTESLFIESGLTASQSRTTGVPAPSCDANVEPEIADRVLSGEFGAVWLRTGPFQSRQEMTLHVHRGLPAGWAYQGSDYSSACRQPGTADFEPRFTRALAQWTHRQAFSSQLSATLTLRGQYTEDRLPTSERISWGGVRLGRAYDSGAVTGDRGYGGLLELSWRTSPAQGNSALPTPQWFAFADHAQGERLASASGSLEGGLARLGSAGAGVRLALTRQVSAELLIAKALRPVPSSDPRTDPRALITISGQF
jgi:hemolysin activation/secretion protein